MPKASTRTLLREDDGAIVRRTVLPGGLRVITEQVPGVRSVAFGVWVGVGSRDESPAQMGSAHYLEHLLFKGTPARSALEISSSSEAVGGDLNAFTTKEYTCSYARVLNRDLPLAIDVVCDVVTDALIHSTDVESERGVILEEIAMHDDDPSDVVHDEFSALMFGDHPLGRPILGTQETITAIPRSSINRFYRSRYSAPITVVSAAGDLDHDDVVARVRRAFAHVIDESHQPAGKRTGAKSVKTSGGIRLTTRPTEQAHLVLGMPGLMRADDRRYAMGVLSTALGGGMSSRLFQEVREKRGMAYSVYSYPQSYADTGTFGVYVGCLPSKVSSVLEVVNEQLALVAASGITAEELQRAKGQVRGATVLGQEDTSARMTRIAKSQMHDEPLLSMDALLDRVDQVSTTDVQELAESLMSKPTALAVIGPFDSASDFGL